MPSHCATESKMINCALKVEAKLICKELFFFFVVIVIREVECDKCFLISDDH